MKHGESKWTESDLVLGNLDLTFKFWGDLHAINKGDIQGGAVHYADLVIKNVDESKLSTIEPIVDDLCWLLSFAHCSEVAAPAFKKESGGLLHGRSCLATYHFFRPVLDTSDGRALMRFLQLTWPNFERLKDTYRLRAALDYYVRSQYLGRTREVGLILSFVLLEHLKHSFASNNGCVWKRVGRKLGWFDQNVTPEQFCGFEALLEATFSAVGMRTNNANLNSVVKLRNEIIHSGLSLLPGPEQERIFDLAQNLCREYILRLLGYSGDYHPYVGGAAIATI
jgi:hypothetical protein